MIRLFELPLFKREVLAILRTRRAFWILVIVVAASSLLPLVLWSSWRFIGSAMAAQLSFQLFMNAQVALGILVIPAFTAGAIAGERERNTYELLYTTFLTPTSIALSKLGAAALYAVLLLLAPAPAACVLYLLGGIAFESILKSYAVAFAAVVSSGLVCLAVSMRCERTAQAAVRGVLWLAFWNVGLFSLLMLLVQLAAEILHFPPAAVLSSPVMLVGGLSPFLPIVAEVSAPRGWTTTPIPLWTAYLAYAGCLSAAHLLYVLIRARRPVIPGPVRRKPPPGQPGRPKPAAVRRARLATLVARLGRKGVPFISNPVFLKEILTEPYGRPWFRRLTFILPLVVFAGLASVTHLDEEYVAAVGAIAMILVFLVVPAASAASIPREIEQGNIDLLRGSLLTPHEILQGKFFGSVASGVGVIAAAGWAILGVAVTAPGKALPLLLLAGSVLPLTLTFTSAVATFTSAVSRRTLTALLVCYLILVGLLFLLPLLIGISGPSDRTILGAHPVATWVICTQWIWSPGRAFDDAGAILVMFFLLNIVGTLTFWGFSAAFSEMHFHQDPYYYSSQRLQDRAKEP